MLLKGVQCYFLSSGVSLSLSVSVVSFLFLKRFDFDFNIVLDLQKSCKDNIESSYILHIQVFLLLTSLLLWHICHNY